MKKFVSIVLGGMAVLLSAGFYAKAQAQDSSLDATEELAGQEEDNDNLSGTQQVHWVEERLTEARSALDHVRGMLEQARGEKDTIKITCLDDKMAQIDVSIQGVEERAGLLKLAVNAKDTVTAGQNFSILKIYFSRIFGLDAEAENCLGESDVVLGKTETTMTVSGDITIEDPSEEEISAEFGVDQPAHISGFY